MSGLFRKHCRVLSDCTERAKPCSNTGRPLPDIPRFQPERARTCLFCQGETWMRKRTWTTNWQLTESCSILPHLTILVGNHLTCLCNMQRHKWNSGGAIHILQDRRLVRLRRRFFGASLVKESCTVRWSGTIKAMSLVLALPPIMFSEPFVFCTPL